MFCGATRQTSSPISAAATTPPFMRAMILTRSSRLALRACAAVVQSSRLRRVIVRRIIVRTIASPIHQARSARSPSVNAHCRHAIHRSWRSARRSLARRRCPVRSVTTMYTGSSDGSPIPTISTAVHHAAMAAGSIQPSTSAASVVSGISVRRRLSTIFQPPSSDIRPGRSHGTSCQSPRAQRCSREATTS